MGLIARKLHWAYWMARYWAMDKYREECRSIARGITIGLVAIQVAWLVVTVARHFGGLS